MFNAAVITASDKGFAGEREDISGRTVCDMLREAGYAVTDYMVLPDERAMLAQKLRALCDEGGVQLVLTTGGTGFSPRDCTPEATGDVAERLVPGIAEAMRMESMRITKRAMLSRGIAALRGETLIVNLPGSPKAARENLSFILPTLEHGLEILTTRSTECATPG